MPPPPLVDLSGFAFDKVEVTREQIYSVLQHRYEFMQIDGIYSIDTDKEQIIAYRDIKTDEWWCKGHIPGRPVFPGILMIESAAHLASYYYRRIIGGDRFLGFAAVDGVKFRGAVTPPSKVIFAGRAVEVKPRRLICDVQAFVNDAMVFEGRIMGMPV